MNSDTINWIVIRDQANDLMYQGQVAQFSDEEDPRELVLSDVSVFVNETGKHMYDVPLMYLSLEKKNVTFEVHQLGEANDERK